MVQYIIVFSIILFAIAYTLYSVVKTIQKNNAAPCGGCSGCDVKKEILKNLKDKQEAAAFQCGDFRKKGS